MVPANRSRGGDGNRVTQVKTEETDGYNAIQVAFGSKKPSRVSKPLSGHYAKAGVEAGEMLKEFHIDADKLADLKVGTTLSVEMFTVGQKVDVTGITIGKGFAGAIKRHHFSSNRASHGNSVTTRAPGSIGNRQDPGRVFPGKRMCNAQRKTSWWLVLMSNVNCCSFAALSPVLRAAKLLSVRL